LTRYKNNVKADALGLNLWQCSFANTVRGKQEHEDTRSLPRSQFLRSDPTDAILSFRTRELFCMNPEPSARLTFRSWTEEDAALAEALWCDSEVTHYFGGAMTREQAHTRLEIERKCENRLGVQYWPMFLRETGEFAGCAGLRPWQMDAKTIEAGVHLMRSSWGLRLGEEALRAVLAYGLDALGLATIVAGHGAGHNNSQKLLERVGFAYTHNILWGAKAIEVRMYAIGAGMWRLTGMGRERT
jgi:ribosomal-protein-alanine N-acetyltransferase